MKKKTILSLFIVLGLLVSSITVPVFAEPTFKLEGTVVLPGAETAPDGGLTVSLEYRSDKGTPDKLDDLVMFIPIKLGEGANSGFFSTNIPFTATGAKYSLSYTVPSTSKYWDRGYYTLDGMKYYSKDQMFFYEGALISNLVITPLRASKISGEVRLPSYTSTQDAIEADVSAKTTGTLTGIEDDFETKTKVNITDEAVTYSLKVPTTVSSAGYIVKYGTDEVGYVEQGWYSATGTVLTASAATKVDVSSGNRTGINLTLVKKPISESTFKLEGKVVLPGTDKAPDGGLIVTLEYRTDKGTSDLTDDIVTPIHIKLSEDDHQESFSVNLPYTVDGAKFSLGYTVPSASKYWDRGYYTLNGMQYYKANQKFFYEGTSISDLVITPLKASKISGTIGLPEYTTTQTAVKVDVKGKTTGTLTSTEDDFEVKTRVSITNQAVAYSLKVPTTVAAAGYIVMYDTNARDYEEQGWYSSTGTVFKASDATKVDVSIGNRTGINLMLADETVPDQNIPDLDFDLNGDGVVDQKDMVLVARAMGSVKKYVEAYDFNEDGVINVFDLKLIKAEIGKNKMFRHNWRHMFKYGY